jgi:hypothetical protein
MTFSPVKSDPYRKGKRKPVQSFQLWPGGFWKRLCEVARAGGDWVSLIGDMNERYYGKR